MASRTISSVVGVSPPKIASHRARSNVLMIQPLAIQTILVKRTVVVSPVPNSGPIFSNACSRRGYEPFLASPSFQRQGPRSADGHTCITNSPGVGNRQRGVKGAEKVSCGIRKHSNRRQHDLQAYGFARKMPRGPYFAGASTVTTGREDAMRLLKSAFIGGI